MTSVGGDRNRCLVGPLLAVMRTMRVLFILALVLSLGGEGSSDVVSHAGGQAGVPDPPWVRGTRLGAFDCKLSKLGSASISNERFWGVVSVFHVGGMKALSAGSLVNGTVDGSPPKTGVCGWGPLMTPPSPWGALARGALGRRELSLLSETLLFKGGESDPTPAVVLQCGK